MPELRLDSFEVDESNKFAVALCKAVVNLEKGYSPLLIHGQQGSGKTHLLSAVSTELTLSHPEISLLYISADFPIEKLLFGEQPGGSNGGSEEFIYKAYSRKDLLLVDDVERFSGDSEIRERFYVLFDTFVDNGKQVLVTSSLPIERLRGFNKRFVSRLRGGIDAPLSSPQPETRLKILKRECERLGLKLDVDILEMLMFEASTDVVYLKKLPGHLKTFSRLTRQHLTKKKVEEFLLVIRSETSEDKSAATTEQIYSSWMQSQAKKREGDLSTRIQQLEQDFSEQLRQTQKLESELETAKSREQAAAAEASALSKQIQSFQEELKEKHKTLRSQEKVISTEIPDLSKKLEKRDKLTEKLRSDHEKALSERDSKISHLEQMLSKASEDLAVRADEEKRAEAATEQARAEFEQRKKDKEDELLALRIQLEDKEENLKVLTEEREMRIAQQEREKSQLQEKTLQAHNENLLLEKTIEDLNARIRELEEQLARSAEELKNAVELQDTATQQREQLAKELEQARSRVEADEEQHTAHMGEKKEREQQLLASLEAKENELGSIKAEREKQTRELQASIDSISKQLEHKEKETLEAASKLESEIERSKNLERELASATASLEELRKSSKSELTELQSKISEKDRAQAGVAELENQLREKIDELSQLLDAERSQTQSTEQRLQELSDRAMSTESELNSAKAESEKALAQNQELSEQLDRMSSERDTVLSSKESEVKKLNETISKLQENLSKQEKLLVTKKKDESKNIHKLKDELKRRDDELQNLSVELDRRNSELETNAESMTRLNEKISALEADMASVAAEKERVEQQLSKMTEEAENKLKTSGRELDELRKMLEEARARVKEAPQADTSRDDELSRLESEHKQETDSLKGQVRDAMNELVRVREELEAQLKQQREEAEALSGKLAQTEAEMERLKAEERVVETVALEDALMEARTDDLKLTEEHKTPPEPAKIPAQTHRHSHPIQWLHTFENFKISEASTFSVEMAEKIARNLGELYNPLCLYGPENSGKTHILHAIGELSTSEDPALTCEFTSLAALLDVITTNPTTVDQWLETMRLILVDDFEVSNVSADDQLRLYYFLRALAEKDAQIVIASKVPPIKINYLEEYLLRFLESGLLVKLEPNPEIQDEQKEAAEALAFTAHAVVGAPEEEEQKLSAEEGKPEEAEAAEESSQVEDQKDFLDKFLEPDPTLTAANFRGSHVFEEFEEAFRSPNKKWRNKFPLLVIENDRERRHHFFHALTSRLQEIFAEPVSLLSFEKLAEMLALTPSFDWNGLLNKLTKSHVILIDDCERVLKLPESATGYLHAIVEEISGRDILLMIGMSKEYNKEPVFENVYKKASRKKM